MDAGLPSSAVLADNVVEEGVLGLAGVGAFSPAPSEPPSPTLSRRDLAAGQQHPRLQPLTPFARLDADEEREAFAGSESGEEDEGVLLRRRARKAVREEEA